MMARFAFCAFILVSLCQPSSASGPEYCHRYASKAVQAQLSNIHYRCGFTGRRWSTDYRDHFVWCVHAPWEFADREERLRSRSLRACQ
jgi:hypothetical protein